MESSFRKKVCVPVFLFLWMALFIRQPGHCRVGLERTIPDRTQADMEARYKNAVRNFDDHALADLIREATGVLQQKPNDYTTNLLVAKCYLARCDLRRSKRKTYDLKRSLGKSLRRQQAEMAETGLKYAEKAVEAEGKSSEAYRVEGELTIHRISGPIAGFRYGPKGKALIEKALELDPSNLEARRAIGLMYLYNPPFNGGNKKKAAETFDEVIKSGGDDRAYVLAARAYLKLKEKEIARERLTKALELNPRNLEAKALFMKLDR